MSTTYTCFGIQNFKSKNGKNITVIHSMYEDPNQDSNSKGSYVEKFFIMTEDADGIDVGDNFIPYYGRNGSRGFIEGFKIV